MTRQFLQEEQQSGNRTLWVNRSLEAECFTDRQQLSATMWLPAVPGHKNPALTKTNLKRGS